MWSRNFEVNIQAMLENRVEEMKKQERDAKEEGKKGYAEYQKFLASEECDTDKDFD